MADQLGFFEPEATEPVDKRDELQALASALPSLLRLGTSTWTYPGWYGTVYSRRYPEKGAAAAMLREYAQYPLFSTVGIDSFFYRPPSPNTLRAYANALPAGFRCCMKVWEAVTAYRLVDRSLNADWLNPALFRVDVLEPTLRDFSEHAGPFIFELQAIPASAHMTAEEFAERLHTFFSALPRDVPFAVELRNPEYLQPVYFDALRSAGVAHCFNSWTHMDLRAQLAHDAFTGDFVVARALLKPGRVYADAVRMFQPYDSVKEPQPDILDAIVEMIQRAVQFEKQIYVIANNRLEGSAPSTIAGIAQRFMLG